MSKKGFVDRAEVFVDPTNKDFDYVLIPKVNINKEYFKYIREEKMHEVSGELGVTYLPFPYVYGTSFGTNEDEMTIKTDDLGDNSSKFSYSHGQLKYLAWEATLGLKYIHECGFVHRNICPETVRAVPSMKAVCIAGFNPPVYGTRFDEPRIVRFASNNELNRGLTDWVFNMHSLAYTLIVLAGGALPWDTSKSYQEILQLRKRYLDISPKNFVNE